MAKEQVQKMYMLDPIPPIYLKMLNGAICNGWDGATIKMKDGTVVSITDWATTRSKMENGKSAQALNDREFDDANIPSDTRVLVRGATRKTSKSEHLRKVCTQSKDTLVPS